MKQFVPEIESDGLSVAGPVREDNQDAIQLAGERDSAGQGLLYAIADGMGGYAHGGMASQMALATFQATLAGRNGSSITKVMQRGVEAANLKVYQKSQQLGVGRMGTTLTAAYVLGNVLYLAHVGDSRAYLIRNGQAQCLTEDHTTVGDMVRSKLIPASRIRTHAQRSILTRAVGLDLFVQPDLTQHKLKEGDRLVLCTDGVWSVLEDGEFAQVVAAVASVETASRVLIERALARETDDNASVVVFHLRELRPASPENQPEPRKYSGWFAKVWKFSA